MLLFLAFFISFAIKVPLFPLHTWLPDAHVEAPTAGSLMLASVMLKMGTYGLIRFCLPLFPESAHRCAPWICRIGRDRNRLWRAGCDGPAEHEEAGRVFIGQPHLGFVVLGIFSFTQQGLDGAVYQMLNHGVSPARCSCWSDTYMNAGTRSKFPAYGGVATSGTESRHCVHDYDAWRRLACRW